MNAKGIAIGLGLVGVGIYGLYRWLKDEPEDIRWTKEDKKNTRASEEYCVEKVEESFNAVSDECVDTSSVESCSEIQDESHSTSPTENAKVAQTITPLDISFEYVDRESLNSLQDIYTKERTMWGENYRVGYHCDIYNKSDTALSGLICRENQALHMRIRQQHGEYLNTVFSSFLFVSENEKEVLYVIGLFFSEQEGSILLKLNAKSLEILNSVILNNGLNKDFQKISYDQAEELVICVGNCMTEDGEDGICVTEFDRSLNMVNNRLVKAKPEDTTNEPSA